MLKNTRKSDPELYKIVEDELRRQESNIEMIASESTVPVEVMELGGSVFTNKTLEGYPGSRFQAGNSQADELEILACKRACELFGADHVNIQMYSGTTANYTVYATVLDPGDKVLAMRLDGADRHLCFGSSRWQNNSNDVALEIPTILNLTEKKGRHIRLFSDATPPYE